MKYVFFLILFLIGTAASAHLELAELDKYLQLEQDQLQKKVAQLQAFIRHPGQTQFLLDQPNLVFERPLEIYHECLEEKCRIYERKVFNKIASFRTDDRYNNIHNIWIEFVRIPVSSLEIWESNPAGQKLRLLKEQIKIEPLSFSL